jgi:hypothetical protein
MKRILILILSLIVFAAACDSAKNPGGGSGTSMQGTWTVTGNLGSQSGPATYQVQLVSSPCSVTTPVGTFAVQGPVCFIANNNSSLGSISGTGSGSHPTGTSQGVLVGVAANPVADDAAFNLVFVAGDGAGDVVEFTGSGSVTAGTRKGTGSCSKDTPICVGVSATFSGTQQ